MCNEIKKQWGKRRTQTGDSLIAALVRPGEEIQIDDAVSQIPDVRVMEKSGPLIPEWLEKRDHGGLVLREPNRDEIHGDIQEQRIVEF